jgi:hypothetical protein
MSEFNIENFHCVQYLGLYRTIGEFNELFGFKWGWQQGGLTVCGSAKYALYV